MKIALFGAMGNIGRRIAQEALTRGHEVTAVARDPSRVDLPRNRLTVAKGDVLNPDSVATAVAGHDIVISAVGPGRDGDPQMIVKAAHSLIDGVKRAKVRRLIVVGGAGSLEIASGRQLIDTPEFPAAWKPAAEAHRAALAIYRAADLDWTYLSPAAFIQPGERTGKYRTGTDQLVTDERGESRISMEDYAMALLDEVEHPKFIRQRFTAAH
ncbi:MAG TPA: NAD(P)-dependent oxidoreductase [Methylomirabilota bacterium]|nr:NAD(P)-dependent oxidoreductase [Methylomirabilota bacterium]